MPKEPVVRAFRDLAITIAVDKSGSTYGGTLTAEQGAIRQVLALLEPTNAAHVSILPWCDTAGVVLRPAALNSIRSGGGTNPSKLYSYQSSLGALRSSELWFLFTDGQIEEALIEEFATNTAEHGLHNRACVVVVFGSTMRRPPAECDISVGKAAYALAPDCLFLFHDTATARVSILQAKGCFRELLPRTGSAVHQPHLNNYTSWGDLPQMAYEDLATITVTLKQSVGKEEMVLQDDTVLNIQELYAGSVRPETIEAVLRDEDALKSLVMAEAARGRSNKLQDWLKSQERETPQLGNERPDIHGTAQEAVSKLLSIWSNESCKKEIAALQASLRAVHARNRAAFSGAVDAHKEKENEYQRRSSNISSARTQSAIVSGANAKSGYPRPVQQYQGRSSLAYEFSAGWDDPPSNSRYPPPIDRQVTAIKKRIEIYLPGFTRSNSSKDCAGLCMLCLDKSLLSLLLTADTTDGTSTQNFPRRFSGTELTFPLAMNKFVETDILSFFLCCDACAFHLVRNSTSPFGERIVSALPLVDVRHNHEAWVSHLDKAYKGRFARDCILQVFLATLDKKLQLNKTRAAQLRDKSIFRTAAEWAQDEIVLVATAAPLLSPAFGKSKKKKTKSLSILLEDEAFMDPALPINKDLAMLRYPMSGFAVIIRLLQSRGVPKPKLQHYCYLRLLFEITSRFITEKETGGVAKLMQEWQQKLVSLPPDQQSSDKALLTPLHLLPEKDMVDDDDFETLRELFSENTSEVWLGYGLKTYVQILLENGKGFEDVVEAFNELKLRKELERVMSGGDLPSEADAIPSVQGLRLH